MQFHIVVGNITKADPVVEETENGKKRCRFAISDSVGTGKYKHNIYLSCTAWGKNAELIAEHYHKHDTIALQLGYDDKPFRADTKGYNIPNPQWNVEKIIFTSKPKSNDEPEEDDENEFQPVQAINDIKDDLPF